MLNRIICKIFRHKWPSATEMMILRENGYKGEIICHRCGAKLK